VNKKAKKREKKRLVNRAKMTQIRLLLTATLGSDEYLPTICEASINSGHILVAKNVTVASSPLVVVLSHFAS
jgi:hypothetical protein